MPLLGATDALPALPSRVLVAGSSGSGKTTVARRIAVTLMLPHTEIDALFHGAAWTRRPSFEADVEALAAGPAWVTEYQYPSARPLLLQRCDLLVVLQLPRALVMGRVVRRTVSRRRRRTVLWNGNLEPPLRTLLTDREHILRWAWRTWPETPGRTAAAAELRPMLPIVVLRSQSEVGVWLAGPLQATVATT